MVAKKTSLTDSPCQNASSMIPVCIQRADALCEEKQAGGMEGFRQRHQGDDRPLVVRGLLPSGPQSDNTERVLEQRIHLHLIV